VRFARTGAFVLWGSRHICGGQPQYRPQEGTKNDLTSSRWAAVMPLFVFAVGFRNSVRSPPALARIAEKTCAYYCLALGTTKMSLP
jgi:hypothetical protein